MKNYSKLNEYEYYFCNKETKKITSFITWCYGNIYEQINIYKNNLTKMCLIGVSNDTHKIIKVVHLFDDSIIYQNKNY